jgi:DNA polymerase III subunit alpha
MEVEKIKKQVEPIVASVKVEEKIEPVLFDESTSDDEAVFTDEIAEDAEPIITETITIVEETKVITRLTMPSRKLKIKISTELLAELENLQVDFKLN